MLLPGSVISFWNARAGLNSTRTSGIECGSRRVRVWQTERSLSSPVLFDELLSLFARLESLVHRTVEPVNLLFGLIPVQSTRQEIGSASSGVANSADVGEEDGPLGEDSHGVAACDSVELVVAHLVR